MKDSSVLPRGSRQRNRMTLRKEHFSYSATTRGKEFITGKIAMITIAGKNGRECLTMWLAAPMEAVPQKAPEAIATVKSNMTILKTSFYIVDTYCTAMVVGNFLMIKDHIALKRGGELESDKRKFDRDKDYSSVEEYVDNIRNVTNYADTRDNVSYETGQRHQKKTNKYE